jgi:nicotinamide riboside kinase
MPENPFDIDLDHRLAMRRVAVIGAESTGKTALCRFLAQHLEGWSFDEPLRQWVEHYGRSPTANEQWEILQRQRQAEDQALLTAYRAGKHWVLCDSAPILTAVYSQFYFQDPVLMAQAIDHHKKAYTHTLVCDTDLIWQPEPGMRDGPQVRAEVQGLLLQALQQHGIGYFTVRGMGEHRGQLAAKFLTGVDFAHR